MQVSLSPLSLSLSLSKLPKEILDRTHHPQLKLSFECYGEVEEPREDPSVAAKVLEECHGVERWLS